MKIKKKKKLKCDFNFSKGAKMQGKILSDGLISGNDGNRYNFSIDDVKNLDNKTINDIINAEVDFEVEGTEAKSIFVVQIPTTNTIGNIIKGEDIQSIKIKAYLYVAGILLLFIPVIGQLLAIVGLVAIILNLIAIGRISGVSLLKHFILSRLLVLVGVLIIWPSVAFGFAIGVAGNSTALGLTFGILGLLVGLALCVAGLFCYFFYYRNLAEVTNEKLFFYSFISYAIGIATIWIFFIGLIGIIVAVVLELIAWINLKEIRKKENL